MYEKVNPYHPDKLADRIAGAIIDKAYEKKENPKAAVEVLIGHNKCLIINETDTPIEYECVKAIVERITNSNEVEVEYKEVAQDTHLARNQEKTIKCGDNGIFKGVPKTQEQIILTEIAKTLTQAYNADGKYILSDGKLTICQSNANNDEIASIYNSAIINPLGEWTGGINVDSGATNRKLGSDMGDSVTGGGLHGKDLSKADVSVNIYCYIMAQQTGYNISCSCSIGDEMLDFYADEQPFTKCDYTSVVNIAKEYIKQCGGFEKFAEWGLIR